MPISRAFFYASGFHKQSSRKDRCSISMDLLPLSQFSVSGPLPQVPQRGPYGERHPSTEPSSTHPLIIFPSESPVREPPSTCPNRVPVERDTPSPESSPSKKEPSYEMGENIRSPHMEPHVDRRPTYRFLLHLLVIRKHYKCLPIS